MVIKRDSQEKDKKKIDKEGKKDFTKATEQGVKQINKERRSSQDERNMARGITVPKNNVGKKSIRDEKIKNNRMFREDEGMFYQNINNTKEKQGTVPDIEKFVDFWAGIWEDETSTPYRR